EKQQEYFLNTFSSSSKYVDHDIIMKGLKSGNSSSQRRKRDSLRGKMNHDAMSAIGIPKMTALVSTTSSAKSSSIGHSQTRYQMNGVDASTAMTPNITMTATMAMTPRNNNTNSNNNINTNNNNCHSNN